MYYKSYKISLNKNTVDLAKDAHVFYRASKKSRQDAIKTIIDSTTNTARIFLLSDFKMKVEDDSLHFNIEPEDADYNTRFLVHDMERTYDLLMYGKQKFRTLDEMLDFLDIKELAKFTLLIIDDASKYIKHDTLTNVLRLLQKGRAVGIHLILMDNIFINNLNILANIPCKIVEKN